MPLLARVWPNGEFAIAVKRKAPVRPPKASSATGESMLYSWTPNECHTWDEWQSHYKTSREAIEKLVPGYLDMAVGEVAALGLSDVTNSHKRKKRGTGGLTGYARKMLRNCAWMLGRKCKKYELGMITLTLPSMDAVDDVLAVNSWSEIMRQFNQWLGRKLIAAGACPWVVGCCEIQPERQAREGGLPLHSHLLVQTRVKKQFVFSPSEIRDRWQSLVLNVSGITRSYNFGSSTRVETVRSNCENYLAKYLSKGVDAPGLELSISPRLLPKSWWYATNGIKEIIKKSVRYLSEDDASFLFWLWRNADWGLVYKYDVCPNVDRTNVPIAWVGKLNERGFTALRAVWYNTPVQARKDGISDIRGIEKL